jgi:thioredoxin reductase (NADPH)
VYYAATLIEARICLERTVVIVGGGNSAGQAAVYLARHASKVHLVVRDSGLGVNMSRYLVDQIERNPAVEVLLDTEVRKARGEDGVLEALVVENNRTGQRRTLDASLLFVFIGATPCTAWLAGSLALDERGYVRTGADVFVGQPADRQPHLLETNWPGVLAVGDVRSGSIKRVASAVGEGSMAVRLVHEHLARMGTPAQ